MESDRPEISLGSLLAPHQQQAARRRAAERVVLLAQDTTALSDNPLLQTEGLGSIGQEGSRGLFLHSLHAFPLDGIPRGTVWAEAWARPQESDRDQRPDPSTDEKESGRWVRALQAGAERARPMPQTLGIVSGDRESDLYDLSDQVQAAPKNLQVLIRAKQDRSLEQGGRLLEQMAAVAPGGTREVNVPRRKDRPARVATLDLRWMEVEIKPPAAGHKKSRPSLKLYAIRAKERAQPGGKDPIDGLLLTTWPVRRLKRARRRVRSYAWRWGIECWHRVLKEVCGVETRQMKSAQALERALALDMIVAWRALAMTRVAKDQPNWPAEILSSQDELEVLDNAKKKYC